MANNGNRPPEPNELEREYYNSNLYNTIKSIDGKAADSVGRGIGKAVNGVTKAFNSIPQGKSGSGANNVPGQSQGTPGQNAAGPNDGFYHYNYKNVPPQGTAQGQPPRPANPQPHRSSQKRGAQPNYNYNYNYNPVPVPPPVMPNSKVIREGSNARFILAGIFAFFYAFNFPMYRLFDILIMLGVGVAGYFIGKALFKGKKKIVPMEQPAPQPAPKPAPKAEPVKKQPERAKSNTGNPELDKVIDEGAEYIEKLRAANVAIEDPGVSACIDRMEKASLGIFDYIKDKPEKVPQIKKFMNYYLPTTLKLLNSYEKLSRQAVKGENISSTMFDIEGMMQTIAVAFEKQLDSLFGDEAMDIQSDITVFEQILRQEGLKDDDKPLTK